MKLHPLDLTYMGVASIWGNDLGMFTKPPQACETLTS